MSTTTAIPEVDSADGHLLRAFVSHRDEDAFAKLVARHAGLVFGVSQRVLGDLHAAEDVFQATFLVLARDAKKVRRAGCLASWLASVALRIALRTRSGRDRRRESALPEEPVDSGDTLGDFIRRQERQQVDEALLSLPPKYRDVLTLFYLGQRTSGQVADELGLSISAVEGRLKRARNELRLRLARRGVSLSVAAWAASVANQSFAAPPAPMVETTARDALTFAQGTSTSISPTVLELVRQELTIMRAPFVTSTAAVACIGLVLGLGGHTETGAETPAAGTGQRKPSLSTLTRVTTIAQAADVAVQVTAQPSPQRARIGVLDYKQRTPNEQKIEDALEQPTQLDFIDTPLLDAVQFISELHDIPILLDQQSLDEEGISSDDPITISLTDVSLSNSLQLMFRGKELDYVIKNDVLLIVSKITASTMMDTRVYETRHLEHGDLEEVIIECIEPQSWQEGGKVKTLPGCLVVTQSRRAHEQIADLLQQLARHSTNE